MTKNHLYLNSSNLEYTKHLCEDAQFEPVYEYHPEELEKTSRSEFGRIKTDENYYHIILGTPLIAGCPWCGTEPTLKKLDSFRFSLQETLKYCLVCEKCGSRGPILTINECLVIDKKYMDQVIELINQRYKERRTWDSGDEFK